MNALLEWLDDRTGLRGFVHTALYEAVPGGSRWRYVWGSTLVAAFLTQLVTGTVLWMAYSPSTQTAWESVYFIQYHMLGGWLLRGIHHFMAQAMVVLLGLHLLQVVIDGAYRAPREINFWLGLILMQLVLGLSLTGYLLPWDQKGFWATQVATNLMGQVPFAGATIQKIVVGGSDYGHFTLTRFFALHAGVLPGLLILVLVVHVALFRRHGLTVKDPLRNPDATFWPDQVLKDGIACLAVLAFVLFFVLYHGAELGAPADPASPYQAARPEWYFLFLFQFLKFFTGSTEVFGAIVIPGLVMLMLFLMPILGRWQLGHGFNIAFLLGLLLGIGVLTYQARRDDYCNDWYTEDDSKRKTYSNRFEESKDFLKALHIAHEEAERVLQLAAQNNGIPATGALTLLRNDPKTQGPKIFEQWCAPCHNYVNKTGSDPLHDIRAETPSAPNLFHFGKTDWYAGLLDPEQIDGEHYFGNTSFRDGEMVGWVNDSIGDVDEEDRDRVDSEVNKIVQALAAQASQSDEVNRAPNDSAIIDEGVRLIKHEMGCTECHRFQDEKPEEPSAPDLTGHGSREWMIDFISNPRHERFYGENNDRMPDFASHPDDPDKNPLDRRTIELVVDWLRGDWFEPDKDALNDTP